MDRYKKNYQLDGWPIMDTSDQSVLNTDDLVVILNQYQQETDQLYETFRVMADRFGIDIQAAKKHPGKPSDVFCDKLDQLKAQVDVQRGMKRSYQQACERLASQVVRLIRAAEEAIELPACRQDEYSHILSEALKETPAQSLAILTAEHDAQLLERLATKVGAGIDKRYSRTEAGDTVCTSTSMKYYLTETGLNSEASRIRSQAKKVQQ
jgi:electron transfer flavoprotein alpha subunit